ncbi:MAG: hypothetical protein ACOCYE_06045 [Pseudomonadota bacterium]
MQAIPERSPEGSPSAPLERGIYAYTLSAWAMDAEELEYLCDVSGCVEAASEAEAIGQALPVLKAAMADWPAFLAEHAEIQIEALEYVGPAD